LGKQKNLLLTPTIQGRKINSKSLNQQFVHLFSIRLNFSSIWSIRWPIRATPITTPSTFAFVNFWFMFQGAKILIAWSWKLVRKLTFGGSKNNLSSMPMIQRRRIKNKSLNQQFVHLFFHSLELFIHMVDPLAHSGHPHHHSLDFRLRRLLVHVSRCKKSHCLKFKID